MSGPKYMRYRLSPAELQRILQEQLERARQEAIKKEKERMERLIDAEDKNIHSASDAIARQKQVSLDNIFSLSTLLWKFLESFSREGIFIQPVKCLSSKYLFFKF